MNLRDWLAALEPHQTLAIVLGASTLLYTAMANLAWVNRRPGLGRWVAGSRRAWLARAMGELARWLYYLGLPYATLLLGYSSTRALGVWGVDWLGHAGDFVLVGLGALIAITWVWRPYARSEHPHAIDESGWNWARHSVEVLYQEAHWAFYRSGPIVWLASFYWGSLVGLLLVFLEGWSNPFVRANTRDITRADAPLWSGSLAIVSTVVFIFTQNTWACLIIHLIIDLGLRATIGFPRTHTPGGTAAD